MIRFDQQILLRAIEVYGEHVQYNMLQEETMELAMALHKGRTRGMTQERMEAIEDEYADTLIMTEQFKFIFDMERIQKRVDFKLDRLSKRIDKHVEKSKIL